MAAPVTTSKLWESMHLLGPRQWSVDLPEEYHGPHVAGRKPGCELIEWRRVHPPRDRVRVLSHTCECLAVVYELCGLRGAYFIRRTTRGPGTDEVAESPRLIAGQAGDLWFRLLRGHAR